MIALALLAALQAAWPEAQPVMVAHRGGIVEGVPENTLAAFRAAAAAGVQAIEVDLRATRDGAIVILHDATLDRTTNGKGALSERTLAEVRALDAGRGERVPLFEEALALARRERVKLLLDIKEAPGLDKRRIVRMVEEHGAVLDVIVGPRTVEDLREFRRLNPNLRTLGFIATPGEMEAFVAAGVDVIRLWPKWMEADAGLLARAKRTGRAVWVTAGDAPRADLERLVRMGVDGMLGDRPALLKEIETERRKATSRP